ncbi:MAG: glycosyltransferase family 2 protein [Eubacterium sp.]|nr:glycosyltransferase family 2 protein [Eubacterium sp.]
MTEKNMNDIVSVIIPVYKVENYLRECLDSVINQTYKNLEIILVDDGSPDKCPYICDEYALNDSRIKVVHKQNGGLSDARNAGVNIANGKYIVFVDSDDYIEIDMIEILYSTAEKYAADIVECGVNYYVDKVKINDSFDKITVLDSKDACRCFLDRSLNIRSMTPNKLYKTNIIKQIPFEVGRLHEDMYFAYQALYYSPKYVRIECCKYNYRQQREGSIMTVPIREKNVRDMIYGYEKRNEFFSERKEGLLLDISRASYYRGLLHLLCRTHYSLRDNKELADFIIKRLKDNKALIEQNKYMGKAKIAYNLFKISPNLLYIAYYTQYRRGDKIQAK